MSSVRRLPILAFLAAFAFLPGALAHHCIPDENSSSSDQFTTQSTFAPASGPVVIAAVVFVPLVAIGAVIAALRAPAAPPVAAPRGKWVCTPTAWVWVPEK